MTQFNIHNKGGSFQLFAVSGRGRFNVQCICRSAPEPSTSVHLICNLWDFGISSRYVKVQIKFLPKIIWSLCNTSTVSESQTLKWKVAVDFFKKKFFLSKVANTQTSYDWPWQMVLQMDGRDSVGPWKQPLSCAAISHSRPTQLRLSRINTDSSQFWIVLLKKILN